MLAEIREGKYNAILTWAPDRLSRNAGDLGKIVDLMDAGKLLEIRTYSQHFTNNPNEKFLLMILGSQAKLENDNRGINVKRGLRTRVEMGLWPTTPPTGYLTQKLMDKKCLLIQDSDRAPIIRQMFEKMAHEKWSGRKIHQWLKIDINFKTVGNKNLALSNIFRILQNSFYYGEFEYPQGSGNWYQGKHEPLITQEFFEKAKAQLKRDQIIRETKNSPSPNYSPAAIAAQVYRPKRNGNSSKLEVQTATSTIAVQDRKTEIAKTNTSAKRILLPNF